MRVPLSRPDISEKEVEYVKRVLYSGDLSLGPAVHEFESKFAEYIGAKHAVAVSSGTAALHLCMRALGIGPNDEVITTSFSFVASANCVLYVHALPVFIDIDPDTLNIDVDRIRDFLESSCAKDPRTGLPVDQSTGRTVRAILPVHVFGLPCEMGPILALAHEYHLKVVEDACEALGAEYKGRRVGTLSDIGAFAFYPNKQMTTGEGGIIVTNDDRAASYCRCLRNQGRKEDSSWLEHDQLGYNYRLSDIHCALGIAQLERIEQLLADRARAADSYNRLLSAHPYFKVLAEFSHMKRSWFVYVIQFNSTPGPGLRDRILGALRNRGIGCQSYFPAIHRQPYMKRSYLARWNSLPDTENVSDSCLALPMFSTISEDEIRYVCDSLLEVLEKECPSARFVPALPA